MVNRHECTGRRGRFLCMRCRCTSDGRVLAWHRAHDFAAKFAKAYNRMSKCHVVMGELQAAGMALAKSNELEPNNAVNKKD